MTPEFFVALVLLAVPALIVLRRYLRKRDEARRMAEIMRMLEDEDEESGRNAGGR